MYVNLLVNDFKGEFHKGEKVTLTIINNWKSMSVYLRKIESGRLSTIILATFGIRDLKYPEIKQIKFPSMNHSASNSI